MTKILLANLNSAWGVIVNPNSPNQYREIISFDNETIKEEFIKKELFNDEDYKAKLEKQPDVSWTQIDSMSGTFTINPNDYPDETIDTLLNKDFCIMKDKYGVKQLDGKVKQVERISYHTLSSELQGSSIVYESQLDIFFTHDIKDLFKDNKVPVKRSHIDRWKKDNNKKYIFNFSPESELHFEEQISEKINQTIPVKKSKVFQRDIVGLNENISEEIRKTQWLVMYFQTRDTNEPNIKLRTEREDNEVQLPYNVVIVPMSNNFIVNDKNNKETVYSASEVYKKNKDDPLLISVQIYPYYPFDKEELSEMIKTWSWDSSRKKVIIKDAYETITKGTPVLKIGFTSTIKDLIYENNFDLDTDINGVDYFSKPNINDKYNKKLEPKLKCYPFTKIELSNISTSPFIIHPNLLFNRQTLSMNNQLSFSPEIYKSNTYIVSSGVYQQSYLKRYGLLVENNYSLPIEKNAWKEYVANHKVSSITGQVSAIGSGIMKPLMGGIAGAMGGNPITAGLGVVGGGVSGGMDIMNYYAQRADIQNKPNQVQKISSNLQSDFSISELNDFLILSELLEPEKKFIADYFNQYGYNLNGTLKNINELLSSRYYFNYIQADGTFEIVNKNLSAQIKQQINDTMSMGVRVWNCRDINTWKGVKNYENENWEMNLTPSTKGAKKNGTSKK